MKPESLTDGLTQVGGSRGGVGGTHPPDKKHVVVGTAGHIDHGKTALVKALTGIDTDRLKEEKERGITIDLGFAHLALPSGLTVGIVDVPGHERFIKNMLAGVGGIDLVMLVIAGDEGVMPQTREHLAICQLLRVKEGLVVLTKRDLVEEEWLELVKDDVATTLKGTFLEGKPIVPVSAKTGEGLDHLVRELDRLAQAVSPKRTDTTFRLPIDRVFTIKGFGTVVTGTLTSGRVALDDRVEIYPRGREANVRGIQVHGQPVSEAVAGQRTAINLQGVERDAIERGDLLSHPGALRPTFMVDATLQLLKDAPRPLKSRDRVRFHLGTAEVMARVILLDREAELQPGERGYVQFRLEGTVVALPRDRYVIRSYSPIVTIGGGDLLDVAPAKAKRLNRDLLARLKTIEMGTPAQVLEAHLSRAGRDAARVADLRARTPFTPSEIKTLLGELGGAGIAVAIDREGEVHLHRDVAEGLRRQCQALLSAYHRQNPLKGGMNREELRTRLHDLPERVFSFLLADLQAAGAVAVEKDKVRLASHVVRPSTVQQDLLQKIEGEFRQTGVSPPSQEEVSQKFGLDEKGAKELFQLLLDEKKLVRVKEGLFFHADALKMAEERLRAFLQGKKEVTPGDFKELLGVTRKYAIPLLEYFDAQRVTIRRGEHRVLRGG